MNHQIRALVSRWNDEVWNQRLAGTIDELMHPDCKVEVEGVDGQLGREQFKEYRLAFLSAVPDLRVHEVNITADGCSAALTWRVTGTHLGPGLGLPPSGRPVLFNGMSYFEFRVARIVTGFDRWSRGEFIASLLQVRIDELRNAIGFTAREAQVALLLAERFTSKEIASQLAVAHATARRHCEHVLAKLGISSKQDVAAAIGRVPASVLDRHGSDLPGSTTSG